ncbi:MAG TPA: 5'/3'-nucleotidase SurE, partial [Dehalococcoidia bacterium]|nr:5'/3'-nucleotidase SurE [Dehalococcoidia bacterium]
MCATGRASSREEPRLKILVTNDDGMHSRGLWALADALSEVGDVTL